MADLKISQLTSATTPLTGSEIVPLVQSSTTKKVTVNDLTAGKAVSVKTLNTLTTSLADNTTFESTTNTGIYVRWKRPNKSYILSLDINNNGGKNFSIFDETAGATRLDVSDAGDVTVGTGNLIQGTAAKGINFTANTGAAGMTSQLLNWYEEGTYTPTVSASSGTLTTTSVSANYTRIGRQVTVNIQITLTNIGTASGALIATLPYTCGAFPALGCGREDQNTGNMLQARIGSSIPGSVYILTYSNTTVIATGNVAQITITYFV